MSGVVMLVNEFSPISGGSEKQAERLATFMAAQGKPVWVITRRFSGLLAEEKRDGFTVLRPPSFGPGKLKTLTFIFGAIWHLWRLRREYKVIHAHMLFGAAFAAVLARRFLQKRVLVKLGSSGPAGEIEVSRRTLRGKVRLALLRRWADRIIVLDEIIQAEAISVGILPEKIKLISNGIDATLFYTATKNKELETTFKGKTIVLFVGRLVKEKSIPTLLNAFEKALKNSPNLHLILVGKGPDQSMLESLAKELKIQHQITFAGNQDDVRPYLALADIFVLPSNTEGMSNALLEGMAAGIPCLATPVGASPSVLDHGKCGLLLPVGDVDIWAQTLSELDHDPERRASLGQAARRRIMSEYDFSIIGTRYQSLYAELVNFDVNATRRG
mgnify:CR=1 FL=1